MRGANKRRAIKKVIGIGMLSSALPGTWVKPVVESILLPVHAQTSTDPAAAPASPSPSVADRCLVGSELIIPGMDQLTADSDEFSIHYIIDDSDPSNPVLIRGEGDGDGITIRVSRDNSVQISITVEIDNTSDTTSGEWSGSSFNCEGDGTKTFATESPITGNTWNIQLSTSCFGWLGVRLDDIVLSCAA